MTSPADTNARRSRSRSDRSNRLLVAVPLALVVAAIAFATLKPTPLDQGYTFEVVTSLRAMHSSGVPPWFGYDGLETVANVLMFVPLGFLVALMLPRRLWWLAIVLCCAASSAIEVAQGLFLVDRHASVWDVLSNSAGGSIGVALALWTRRARRSREGRIPSRAPEDGRENGVS